MPGRQVNKLEQFKAIFNCEWLDGNTCEAWKCQFSSALNANQPIHYNFHEPSSLSCISTFQHGLQAVQITCLLKIITKFYAAPKLSITLAVMTLLFLDQLDFFITSKHSTVCDHLIQECPLFCEVSLSILSFPMFICFTKYFSILISWIVFDDSSVLYYL